MTASADGRHGSNVLVLASLTLPGTASLQRLVADRMPSGAGVAVVTLTQPPDAWLSGWRESVGTPPSETFFVCADAAAPASDPGAADSPSVARVAADRPSEAFHPIDDYLDARTDEGDRSVVVVHALTELFEYVGSDATLDFLRGLADRVAAADAVGYYRFDPALYDSGTVRALTRAVDSVVDLTGDDEHAPAVDAAAPNPPRRDGASSTGPLSPLRTLAARLFPGGTTDRSEQSTDGGSPIEAASDAAAEPAPSDEGTDGAADRIGRLLSRHGGRMRQKQLVERTGWSKATVSRRLTEMEDGGAITRVRIGREKMVFLAGHEPD